MRPSARDSQQLRRERVIRSTWAHLTDPAIAKMLGQKVRVIDSAEQSAQDVVRRLTTAALLRGSAEPVAPGLARVAAALAAQADELGGSSGRSSHRWGGRGTLRCFVTDDAPRFAKLASRLLGFEVATPTLVCPDELYRLPVAPEDASAAESIPA